MRRLLRRSRAGDGDGGESKPGRRGPEGRSVSVQSDDDGLGASIEGPPELQEAGRHDDDVAERLELGSQQQRSSDSGCYVSVTDVTGVRRWTVLERQDEVSCRKNMPAL